VNKSQKNILSVALCILSAVLVGIFWRIGNQDNYADSLMIWAFERHDIAGIVIVRGLLLRMGMAGIILGAMLPIALVAWGLILQKSNAQINH
jgi:hypothetical protein